MPPKANDLLQDSPAEDPSRSGGRPYLQRSSSIAASAYDGKGLRFSAEASA